MDTVRVGVIGVGALGRHHTRLYGECEGAELVGIFDADPAAAERVASELGVCRFETEQALVDRIDGCSVAVPTDRHFEVVTRLLQQDRHVLVEKPIAASAGEGRRLVEMAETGGRVLQVGHVERFNPVLECLDHVPGSPRFIEAHRLAAYPPPRPDLHPRGTEVSVVLDLMIHDIDVVLSLVNSPVVSVDAVGVPVLSPTEDIANARLHFENGCIANLTASRVSQEQVRKIRVFKTDAYLSLDYGEKKGEVAYRDGNGISREAAPTRDANALLLELEDFCQCIRQTEKRGRVVDPVVSGRNGLAALELAEQILESIARQAAAACRNTGE